MAKKSDNSDSLSLGDRYHCIRYKRIFSFLSETSLGSLGDESNGIAMITVIFTSALPESNSTI